jgi:SAM-dependent methyltransferase
MSLRLNLGSCDRSFPGFTSVDLCEPAEIIADLAAPWPWPNASVDQIRAYDIIEHIGDCQHVDHSYVCDVCAGFRSDVREGPAQRLKRHPRGPIHVMNEAHRVLVPGGMLDIEVPTTEGRGAWQDPTHVTFWNRNSFLYYTDGDAHRTRFGKHYGVTARFKVRAEDHVRFAADGVVKLKISLEAVK